jgi:hypothetical protein
MLFDMAWMGIPFIHNSEHLKHVSCFERYYYPNNKISHAYECLKHIDEDYKSGKGWFDLENIQNFRKWVLEYHSCLNPKIVEEFSQTIDNLFKMPKQHAKEVKKEKYYLMFTDFWPDFNNSYNFFSLLIENTKKDLDVVCCGEADMPHGVQPDAIVFSAFGETWKKYPNVPKIYYTGENTPPLSESSIKLNLGFSHADMVSDAYLRFPLWILEIDWFNCDKERISNPKPIPLEDCTTVNFNALSKKKKFCAFVVSNPNNPVRNLAFEWLYSYKPIDSGGRLFNTIGDSLFAGGGGGGGELKKFEFYKDYKFCLTYENSSSQGYVTEKVLHAKAAGCIPIYWGDPKIERDFNINGMIDARDIRTREELIAAVKAVDENDEEYYTKTVVIIK